MSIFSKLSFYGERVHLFVQKLTSVASDIDVNGNFKKLVSES